MTHICELTSYFHRVFVSFFRLYVNVFLGMALLSATVFTYLLNKLISRYGKKMTYMIGMVACILTLATLWLMPANSVVGTLIVAAFSGSGSATGLLITQCMLPDVIDEDVLQSRVVREGLFVAFFVFFQKVSGGLALLATSVLLDYSGARGAFISAVSYNPESVFNKTEGVLQSRAVREGLFVAFFVFFQKVSGGGLTLLATSELLDYSGALELISFCPFVQLQYFIGIPHKSHQANCCQ